MLLHGAASGPWVFDGWKRFFDDLVVGVPDLHAELDVDKATMADYASVAADAARDLPRPLALAGWSMGGLVALLASDEVAPDILVLLEPSPPAEVQGRRPEVELLEGTFQGKDVYGLFPKGIRSRSESSLARAERQRGISVPTIGCPSLVVYGDEYPNDRGRAIASRYGSKELYFPGLNHWDLVLNPRVPEAIRTTVLG